ncbi:hypothetical protein PMA3_08460 [Pseudomonas silesiensis]|uniref:Uncharacterized protein n=1 Tax=Pseudomonas silesiensis TaxID=1853130 RepID=A0A191YQZ5_9PSED|nr:hypothetical protein PMA3_08460 [Pseudomonas silesiensis]
MRNKAYLKATSILAFTFLYCAMAYLLLTIGTDNLYFDSEKILDRLSYNYEEDQSLSFFDSYTLSAYLYKILTFSQNLNSNMLTSFRHGDFNIISFVFIFQFLTMLYICARAFSYAYRRNLYISLLVFVYMLFSALYLLVPSKDFFIFVLAYITIFVSFKFRYFVYTYSLFRPFLLMSFLIHIIVTKFTLKKTLLITAVVFPVLFFIPMPVGLSKPAAFLTANTGIVNFFPDSNMAVFFLNGTINSIRLFFPFELFFLELRHWLIAVPKMMLSIIFLYCLIKREKTESLTLFILILSFFYVQGLFEPDFGSALRHSYIISPALIKLIPRRS